MTGPSFRDIVHNPEVKLFLETTAARMQAMGYTEHSFRHVRLVANQSGATLAALGDDARSCELARIAGYLHDIGNTVSRHNHAHYGAILAYDMLCRMQMPPADAMAVMAAIANHDEEVGIPVSRISAALILADKADVHRSRVTNRDLASFDIHDRVNYAATKSQLTIEAAEKKARLEITIEPTISSVMEYFEIFLDRMKLCQNAAAFLQLTFELEINGTRLI